MKQANFILPDKQPIVQYIIPGETTLRSIRHKFPQEIPYEMIVFHEDGQQELLSKEAYKLKEATYQIHSINSIYQIYLQLKKISEQYIQLEKDYNKLQNEYIQQNQKIENQSQKLLQNEKEIELFKKQIDQYKTQVQQLSSNKEEDTKKMIITLSETNDKLKKLEIEHNNLKDDNNFKQNQIEERNRKINALELLSKDQVNKIQDMALQFKDLQKVCNTRIREYDILKEDAIQKSLYLEHCLQNLGREFESQTQKITELTNDIESENQQKKQYQKDIENLNSEKQQQTSDIKQLTSAKQQLENKFKNMEKQYNESQQELDETIKKYNTTILQLGQISQDRDYQKRKNQEISQENQTLYDKINQGQYNNQFQNNQQLLQLQNEIQNQKSKNSKLEEENNQLNYVNSQLKSNQETLSYDLQKKQKSLDEQIRQINELTDKIKQINQEKNESLLEQSNNAQQQQERYTKELNEMLQKEKNQRNNEKQQLESKNQKNEMEILRLQKQLQDLSQEYSQAKINYQKQIQEQDDNFIKKEVELNALQNHGNLPQLEFRINRLVCNVQREYNDDIDFTIEIMNRRALTFEKHEQESKCNSIENEFFIQQIRLDKKEIDKVIYQVSDQNYVKCCIPKEFKDMTKIKGIKCEYPVQINSQKSLEKLYLFKCTQANDKNLVGKLFGIKECKKSELSDLQIEQTALDNCLAPLIAQNLLTQFYDELAKAKVNNVIQGFKFPDQYIIITQKHFKDAFEDELQRLSLNNIDKNFMYYVNLIKNLTPDLSDDFYQEIRGFQKQLEKNKGKPNQKSPVDQLMDALKQFIAAALNDKNLNVEQVRKSIQDDINKYEPNALYEGYKYFLDIIRSFRDDMPLQTYSAMCEITVTNDFKKYNGGHQNLQVNQISKFFAAFSYYSLIRSHKQLVVTYLQGSESAKILQFPLVSTFDGFLDKLDQGYNEIRTFESIYTSSQYGAKGLEYLNPLGIKIE